MSDSSQPSTGYAHRESHPKKWLILFTILAIEVMDIVDSTITNVAVPTIRADFGASDSALQWIVGGYALAFAVGLITGGRLGDIYGRKRMFMIGIAAFVLTSLACGLAPSEEALIGFRVLQGFAAAIMIPQGFGMVRDAFSWAEMPKAFAWWGPTVALGAILGPIIGGLLIELNAFDTDWRAVFLVNVPIGIAALYASHKILPESGKIAGTETGLDIPGALLMGLAAGLLIYPLIEGREQGWPAWIFAIGAAGFVLLAIFALYERGRERGGRSTLIATSVFERPAFLSGTLLIALFFGGVAGLLLITTLYLQTDQEFTAVHAGLTLIPWGLGILTGSMIGNRLLLPKLGRHVMHIGLAIMLVGVALLLSVLGSDGHDITSLELAGPLFVLGIGLGFVVPPMFSFVMADLRDHELGSGSGVLNAMQQFGSAAGIAGIGTLYFSVVADEDALAGFEASIVLFGAILIVIAGLVFLLPLQPRGAKP